MNDQNINIDELWKNDDATRRSIYSAIMSRDRFKRIIRSLRFDDKTTRDSRKLIHKHAAVQEFTDIIINNCKQNFNPSPHLCIDERLSPYFGGCPFKVF